MTILGCGAAAPTPYFLTTSQLVNIHDQLILIDCGEGTQLTLRQIKARFQKIKLILISHMHADHTMGLPGLIASMNLLGRKAPLEIHGPAELEEFVKKVWYLTGTHIEFEVNFKINSSKEIESIYECDTFEIHSFPTKHRVPTCGFRISEKSGDFSLRPHSKKKFKLNHLEIQKLKKGEDLVRADGITPNSKLCTPPKDARSNAFAADSAFSPKVVKAVKEVNLLYHEATFESKDSGIAKKTEHSTASDAGRVALEAQVDKLILGHFSNRYRVLKTLLTEAQEVFENSSLAEERKTYLIG